MTTLFLQVLIALALLSSIDGLQNSLLPIGGRLSTTSSGNVSSGYSVARSGVKLSATNKKDNKAMAFLKKIGKVGGSKVDFTNAVGVDEGSGGAKISSNAGKWDHDVAMKKSKNAYRSCVDSGIIDDLTESFPITSSGTQWAGVTDKVMGGSSSGTLVREEFGGRLSNVLTANVRIEDDGGFVQMVTDLALDPAISNTVDASKYDGIEFDAYYKGDSEKENFNVQ